MNISPTKFLQTVSERGWLAFLIVGFVLVLIGAPGALSKFGVEVIDAATRVTLLGFGLVLIVVSFWMKVQEDRRQHQVATNKRVGAVDPKTYDVQITAPKNIISVAPPVSVEGKIKKAPPDGIELWLFSSGDWQGQRSYWPQSRVTWPSKTTWQVSYKPTNWSAGDTRELEMFFVGPDGRALIGLYRRINSKLPKGVSWEPLHASQLTNDFAPSGSSQKITLK